MVPGVAVPVEAFAAIAPTGSVVAAAIAGGGVVDGDARLHVNGDAPDFHGDVDDVLVDCPAVAFGTANGKT